ncbi:hypothetical protein FV228_01335 [Methylobacterium sp. WL18]|uniref:hypothetical protein n=1 Tax=Methylobacterium sp. WL18 TaxID=2603897 RepID=UPI0011CC5EEA|nr:hypothetical protein [Methylobacterium sp. WL18]TXN76169.1 hypothetical protein FV228_01335 [Methylobacterium sp. WL18]
MTASCTIRPPVGALACANCTAWSHWDHVTVGQDGPGGFRVIGQKPTGQCRANPPSINSDAIGSETAIWPVVGSEDWCRQFEMRDQHEVAA